MKRFVQGQSRTQTTLLPECLDDYVREENPVRVIDAFVDQLDLGKLGFEGVDPAATGRPGYHPAALLKIYIYGYLNRVQSSRRLERETQRNVELMWLIERLSPDFKTIARFRKDNGKAIRGVCRQFVLLCRELGLLTETLVAIDGSKFKAVNNRDRNFTSAKLKRRMKDLEAGIERYFRALDTADRAEPQVAALRATWLKDKIEVLKAKAEQLKGIEAELNETPDKQISLTDPDARSMKTRGTGIVGYNVQTAVDTKHHLIIAHEVTNDGIDCRQLTPMAEQARSALGCTELSVVADRGYFRSEEILACEQAGIRPIVPKPQTSNSKAEGRFGKQDFVYDAQTNEYRCPAGQRLTYRFASIEDGLRMHTYSSSVCPGCPLRAQCSPGPQPRRVRRWENEAVLEAMQDRLDYAPEMMRVRRQTVEHPFGTIKAWMGATHFLTRTLPRVRTEMSLHVLAYNLKRVMNLLGIAVLIRAIKARRISLRSIRSCFRLITTVLSGRLGQRIRQLRFLISQPEAA
jgi:transposase